MQTRTVKLTDRLNAYIEEAVASGRYVDASDVIREGLRLLALREWRTEPPQPLRLYLRALSRPDKPPDPETFRVVRLACGCFAAPIAAGRRSSAARLCLGARLAR
jgi:putative addiction module CopG family antidote